MKNTGYKQMLRDRMPRVINLALKYCKAKERWIDNVYDFVIKKYPIEKRSTIVKIVLGIKQQYTRQEIHDYFRYVALIPTTKEQMYSIPKNELFMRFRDTIDWRHLDPHMYLYWTTVVEWVEWFRTVYVAIQDTYEHSLSFGNDEITTRTILKDKYGINDNLVEYLIKSFK